jgi:hypothetical protein
VSVLDQAVQQIKDLRQVLITYSTFCLQLKIPSSFQGYLELLHKAATVCDAHQQSRSRNLHDSRRKIYASNLAYGTTDFNADYGPHDYQDHDDHHQVILPYYGEDDDFNIDTPLSTINVYATQQYMPSPGNGRGSNPSPGPSIPDAIFDKMSIEDKRAWFIVSRDIRRLLLERIDQGQRSVDLVNPPTGISSVNRRVLRTETTPVADSDNIAPDPERLPDEHVVYETANIPANASPTFPGDLQRLMSSSSARNTSGKYKVNKTLTYTLKKASIQPHPPGALIDCGANGGIAGADCRIIARNPDAFVNIEGIDRHQVTNVPVVTCGAYAVTKNHGPVILIFHQLAGIQKGQSILLAGQMEAFHNKVN